MVGWIKLHRKVIDWEWYQDSNTFRLFIHCLINANTENKKWKGIDILRGQFFTSVSHLSRDLKLTDKQIRISLDKLKSTENVAIKGANKGTMISICNYDSYQSVSETKGQTDGQTKGKQRATTKELKKERIKELYNNYVINLEENWKSLIIDWLVYKLEINEYYNSEKSLNTLLNHIKKISKQNPTIARQIIDNSIACCYSGLFEPKQNNNTNGNNKRDLSTIDHSTAKRLADM